jgi:hypothetical protein
MDSLREADCGDLGVPSRSQIGEGLCRRCCSGTYQRSNTRGLRGWHARKERQRKTGTARGWPRRSRTAEASHISRSAMKLGCAREWGGWGRLSVDGRDSITRTGARAPGVGGAFHRMAVQYIASTDPTLGGSTLKHEGRRQTGRRTVYAGSRLKLTAVPGRSRLIRQPSSRNGENPPCGMIGGAMETAASFEVRNAPSSYPTEARGEIPRADSAEAVMRLVIDKGLSGDRS